MLERNMPQINTVPLIQLLSKNWLFHVLLEQEVADMPFGQITFNFEVKDGTVVFNSLNVVKNRRRRYSGRTFDTGE